MKEIIVSCLSSVLMFSSIAAYAKDSKTIARNPAAASMSDQCLNRVKTVFAAIPGDDGTSFKASDVTVSNVKSVGVNQTVGGTSAAVPILKATLSITDPTGGPSSTGHVIVQDAAGGCYIQNLTFSL